MKNADKFKNVFGLYATEVWSMPEGEFLRWLNSESTEIEQEQRWIPCSEKLPKKVKEVLVTRHYLGEDDNNKSYNYVEIATRYGDNDNPDWISYSDEYKIHPKNHIVIAWMPLPEPYLKEKR